ATGMSSPLDLPKWHLAMAAYKSDEISRLYGCLQSLGDSDRQAIRLSLDRLNSCQQKRQIADRAIDLGIALEILLMHGASSSTEIGYKVGVRGASFIGSSSEDRCRLFELL